MWKEIQFEREVRPSIRHIEIDEMTDYKSYSRHKCLRLLKADSWISSEDMTV